MGDMIKMVVVLTVLAIFSGGALAYIKDRTTPMIEYNKLKFVKGPAIKKILEGASNDPIVDRFKIIDGDVERNFFVGVFDGKAKTVAFESSGKGYGGEVGLMIGVDLETDMIVGVGVTTHSETPGLGSRAKTDPEFAAQFQDKSLLEGFKVTTDGGQIDAISGATITSRAVASGASDASKVYKQLKSQIQEQTKSFN